MTDYAHALLHAGRILHQRGYGLLRIEPTFYATGHWRCSFYAWDGQDTPPVDVLRYSSALLWDYFGDDTTITDITPEDLADRMEEKLPNLQSALGENKAYTWWYNALLEHVGARTPYMYSEYDPSWTEKYMGFTDGDKTSSNPLDYGFPLPPQF